jgi:hypothetical protein
VTAVKSSGALRQRLEAYVRAFRFDLPEHQRSLLRRNPAHLRKGELMSFQIDGHGTSVEPIYVVDAVCRGIASDIFEMPEAEVYASPQEVHDVLERTLMAQPGAFDSAADIDINEVVGTMLATLRAPPQRWTFRTVLFPAQFDVTLSIDVGGRLPVQLGTVERDAGHKWLCLNGEVLAHTEHGALAFAEQTTLTVLGAGIASGVLVHEPPTTRPAPPVSVTINGGEHYFESITQGIVAGCWVEIPRDVSELERANLMQGRVAEALTRHVRIFEKALAAVGARADEVRNACRMACLAATSSDESVTLPLCFALLEGLLLDAAHGDNVLARLREAIAHSLGADHDERLHLRAELKRLYDLRSGFVHSVRPRRAAVARQQAVELALRVLKREIELLR